MSSNEWKESQSEIDFVAQRLIDKVFQGNPDKLGLAKHCASVAICAVGDFEQGQTPPHRMPPLPSRVPSQAGRQQVGSQSWSFTRALKL